MTSKLYQLAKDAEPDVVRFLGDIIAIPSLSGQEEDVVRRIEQEMERLEFDDAQIDPMGNLIGRVGSGPVQVALDAHVDTVDVQPDNWDTDPFDPVVKDGFMYGRGTSDMKGGLASSVYAAALLKKSGLLPENLSLYVTASVLEEDCDGLCWQYIAAEDKLRPDVVVITEPTSLRIYRGQRGRMEIEVATSGVSCHGSAPARGVNAIYKMAGILEDIERLNSSLPPIEPLGQGSVTVSHIRSTAPSLCAVADGCTIHLDRRLTTGETLETSVAEIEALPSVQATGAKVTVLEYAEPSYTGLVYPTQKYFPSWQSELTDPCVEAAVDAYRQAFATDPDLGFWTFSTNGVATAGIHGIPSVGFGPGEEKWAHADNEKVAVEDLVCATAFYMSYAREFVKR